LTQKHGNKILVIQNEFGAGIENFVGIFTELIVAEIGLEQATIVNQDGGSSQVICATVEYLDLSFVCFIAGAGMVRIG
jgi:hypothetical protein